MPGDMQLLMALSLYINTMMHANPVIYIPATPEMLFLKEVNADTPATSDYESSDDVSDTAEIESPVMLEASSSLGMGSRIVELEDDDGGSSERPLLDEPV